MLSFARVAAAIALIIGGFFSLNLSATGATAAASPSSGPALDTSAWTTYTSDRYGFSIGHPADWTERPADHTWTLPADADWLSTASEGFIAPGESILATAWSVAVDPGTTADAWIAAYCPLNQTSPCPPPADRTVAVTLDGHPGSLVQFDGDTQAFFLVGNRMYMVAVWEDDADTRTAPYGGATRLLEGYLSTVHLLPGGPATPSSAASPAALDTSAWTTYTSDRYGFSIGHPADWTERPADHTWTLPADADWLSTASEGFIAPGESILATAWSVAVDPGTTADAWIAAYCPLNQTSPCPPPADRTVAVTLDGHPGSLVQFDGDTQAFFLVGNRMYMVAVWEDDADTRTAPYGGATRLLEGYLSTVHLLPGGPALDTPLPSPSPS